MKTVYGGWVGGGCLKVLPKSSQPVPTSGTQGKMRYFLHIIFVDSSLLSGEIKHRVSLGGAGLMPINYTCCRALFDWMRQIKCLKQSCREKSLEDLSYSATYHVYWASLSVLKSSFTKSYHSHNQFGVQTSILLPNV